jgi:hypothetical protein
MPDAFGCTCDKLVCVFLSFAAHETAGATAPGIPCALASPRDIELAQPGRNRAAGVLLHVFSAVMPAKAGIQYSRDVSD